MISEPQTITLRRSASSVGRPLNSNLYAPTGGDMLRGLGGEKGFE